MSRSQPTREEVLRYGRERAQRERRRIVVYREGDVWYVRPGTAPDRFVDELHAFPGGAEVAARRGVQ